MLQVIVLADGMRGKSTLAAMIARTLSAAGIPIELHDGDPEAGDADFLLKDTEGRLARNIGSIAGREAAVGGKVLITTQQLGRSVRSRAFSMAGVDTAKFGVPPGAGKDPFEGLLKAKLMIHPGDGPPLTLEEAAKAGWKEEGGVWYLEPQGEMKVEGTETMRVTHNKPNMIEVDRVREVAAGGSSEDVPFPEPTGKKSSFHPGLSMKTVHVERTVPHPRGSGFDGPQGSG